MVIIYRQLITDAVKFWMKNYRSSDRLDEEILASYLFIRNTDEASTFTTEEDNSVNLFARIYSSEIRRKWIITAKSTISHEMEKNLSSSKF